MNKTCELYTWPFYNWSKFLSIMQHKRFHNTIVEYSCDCLISFLKNS